MAEQWLAQWEERVRAIASNLLALEVNTVVKNGMVAQKMPEIPVALHAIVQEYNGYTAALDVPVTHRLLVAASGRLSDAQRSGDFLKFLRDWAYRDDAAWPGPGDGPPEDPLDILTNGAEAFEALVWAAAAARERALRQERDEAAPAARRLDNQRRAAILTRIEENSRQLREVAIVLEKAFSSLDEAQRDGDPARRQRVASLQTSTEPYLARLAAVMNNPVGQPAAPSTRLFGGTLDQTTQALFRHPRPALNIDPDITVLIRKVWDVGLEEVRLQTVVQLDGDVLLRVAEMPVEEREFLATLHRTAVDDGLKQWRLLFKIVGDLVSGIGGWLFGASGTGDPAATRKL